MSAKNFASTRYSGLDEINGENARGLKLDLTFPTGVLRGHEAAPIVANQTMYIVTPYPTICNTANLAVIPVGAGGIVLVQQPSCPSCNGGIAKTATTFCRSCAGRGWLESKVVTNLHLSEFLAKNLQLGCDAFENARLSPGRCLD
jgi:hypothetical protein